MRKKKVAILLGPNISAAGKVQKGIYGEETAESINSQIILHAEKLGLDCEIFQSNCEGLVIDKIEELKESCEAAIINPGALAHYSYALRDAISLSRIPFVEVHASNIKNKEKLRGVSVTAEVCEGQIIGFGKNSYILALNAVKEII